MSKRANRLEAPTERSVLGARSFAAISAIEGLRLSPSGEKRLAELQSDPISPHAQRRRIIEAYAERKSRG